MKYLVNVLDGSPTTGQQTFGAATDAEMVAIDAFNERIRADGHWVFAAGLAAPQNATVVDNREEAGLVMDGPYIETCEVIVGIWIWDAPNVDTALQLAADASKTCNRRLEVRAVL